MTTLKLHSAGQRYPWDRRARLAYWVNRRDAKVADLGKRLADWVRRVAS